MPYTREHKEKTRAKIVDAARRLFNRHGFAGVSIDDIMGEAGLTRGGFYNHFGTKEELYAAVVSRVVDPHHAGRVEMAILPTSSPSLSPPICRGRIWKIARTAVR